MQRLERELGGADQLLKHIADRRHALPGRVRANAASSADAAIGTTPVKAAEPAAVVAAISPVTTDSVNDDRFTASGETSNIDMLSPVF
jgi:hypothetical protein